MQKKYTAPNYSKAHIYLNNHYGLLPTSYDIVLYRNGGRKPCRWICGWNTIEEAREQVAFLKEYPNNFFLPSSSNKWCWRNVLRSPSTTLVESIHF